MNSTLNMAQGQSQPGPCIDPELLSSDPSFSGLDTSSIPRTMDGTDQGMSWPAAGDDLLLGLPSQPPLLPEQNLQNLQMQQNMALAAAAYSAGLDGQGATSTTSSDSSPATSTLEYMPTLPQPTTAPTKPSRRSKKKRTYSESIGSDDDDDNDTPSPAATSQTPYLAQFPDWEDMDAKSRNRVAASKSRRKKKREIARLEEDEKAMERKSEFLRGYAALLQSEVFELQNMLLAHSECSCESIRSYFKSKRGLD